MNRKATSVSLATSSLTIILLVLNWSACIALAQQQPDNGNDALAAPLLLASKQIQTEFASAKAGAAAGNGLLAAAKSDLIAVRRCRDRLGIDDSARVAMSALEILTDPTKDVIEPFSTLKYHFIVDQQSHALLPTSDSRPTTKIKDKLELEFKFQPDARSVAGHAIHYGLALQLLRTAATKNASVVLADDVLFSRGHDPYVSEHMQRPFSSEPGLWTLLSFNTEVSERYSRLPYVVFLQTLVNQSKASPLFYSGLWQELLPYAEELSPGSQKAWVPVYIAVAEGFEAKRRYASGAFIRIAAGGQKVSDCYAVLLRALKSVFPDERAANRNIAIAYGYLLEAQVHFGKDVSPDLPQHREITTLLTNRLDDRDLKSVLATRTAPQKPSL